jgi:hypothetical protein
MAKTADSLPKIQDKDAMREELTKIENAVLAAYSELALGSHDARWLALATTNTQLGFMCAKRALYEGKRVGDA